MVWTDFVAQLIGILVSGITGIATGIGQGLSTLANEIFITNGQLSTFGGLVVVFAGISLAVGLSRAVVAWVGSLGGRSIR